MFYEINSIGAGDTMAISPGTKESRGLNFLDFSYFIKTFVFFTVFLGDLR